MKIFIATRNKDKIKELKTYLEGLNIDILSYDDIENLPETVEDGKSFKENAVKKATELARATGILTIADDSGLIVDALDGRPGILSSRYAGENATDKENNQKLLDELRDVSEENRTARFVCNIAIADPGGLIKVVEGICEGRIATEERGNEGFGYDPLFIKNEYNKTFAELGLDIKNRISHRALALEKAVLVIENYMINKIKRK